jgi:Holliday junction resolvase RusA-like endonuclease
MSDNTGPKEVVLLLSDGGGDSDTAEARHGTAESPIIMSSDPESGIWCEHEDADGNNGDANCKLATAATPKKIDHLENKKVSFYWTLQSDKVDVVRSSGHQHIKFTIRGKPRPLRRPGPRPRGAKNPGRLLYNSSKGEQKAFRQSMMSILPPEEKNAVLFPKGIPVSVKLVFFLRRPSSHFVCGCRGGELKNTAPRGYAIGNVDVDNLIKFVLDCLNQLIFHDDRQATSIQATKRWDIFGTCEGASEIDICVQHDSE